MTNVSELARQIADYLESERVRFAAAEREAGIPASVRRQVTIATPGSDDRSLQGADETVDESPVGLSEFSMLAIQMPARSVAAPIAHSLVDVYGDECQVWSAAAQPSWDEGPAEWVEGHLLSPLAWEYMDGLSNIDRGDDDLAKKLAAGLVELLSNDTVTFVTSLALAGVSFDEEPLSIDDVSFRRLNSRELGSLMGGWMPRASGRRDAVPAPHEAAVERWAMEVRTSCTKAEQPWSKYRPDRILLALQLLGYEPHGRGRARTWTEPPPSTWHGFQGYRLPRHGESRPCSADDLQRALRLADRLPEGVFAGGSSPHEIALHRFLLGSGEDVLSDALIDHAISLEAVLLEDNKELRFKLSLFGACYLDTDIEERHLVFKRLTNVYDTRSDLVHGVGKADPERVSEAARDARELAGRVLVKAVEQGWPTQEQLKDLCLS